MSEQDVVAAPTSASNSAWAEFRTPFTMQELKRFCDEDVERLFRINPYLEFKKWEKTGENQYHVIGKNISHGTDNHFEFEDVLTVKEVDDGVLVSYQDSLKKSTLFKLEPLENVSKMSIIDEYVDVGEEEIKARENEVDRSLTIWGEYLLRYMMTWKKWSWISPWRWYMRRVWQPMKPMSRRISYMLIWITIFEIALIALGVAIYFAEYA
ncbi:MAG: hypothetical protein OEY52_11475 [Gammaproteobacteria bacterium]|nr:hypothetical protein [Gammaproteobacteria bacterium]